MSFASATPVETPNWLEALPSELLPGIIQRLGLTDGACFALTNTVLHNSVAASLGMLNLGHRDGTDHMCCALATRTTPGVFVDYLDGVFDPNCSCHYRALGRALPRCKEPQLWTPALLEPLGGRIAFSFDAAETNAIFGSDGPADDYEKLVRLSILTLWSSANFSYRPCSRDAILLTSLKVAFDPRTDYGTREELKALEAEVVAQTNTAIDCGIEGRWIVELLSEDETGHLSLIYELEADDNDLLNLCWPASEWRALAEPLVDEGHLSHAQIMSHVLPRLSMPVQRAVFCVEYTFALRQVEPNGARQLAETLAAIERATEPQSPDHSSSCVGGGVAEETKAEIAEIAWWCLAWLVHLADDMTPFHTLSVNWAESLVAFVEVFTERTRKLPFFGYGPLWDESHAEQVVLDLFPHLCDLPPQYSALGDMVHRTCRFSTRRGFGAALGRCAGIVRVPHASVVQILTLYTNKADGAATDPNLRGSPENMAARICSNGASFFSAWAKETGFPRLATHEARHALAHFVRRGGGNALFGAAADALLQTWAQVDGPHRPQCPSPPRYLSTPLAEPAELEAGAASHTAPEEAPPDSQALCEVCAPDPDSQALCEVCAPVAARSDSCSVQ